VRAGVSREATSPMGDKFQGYVNLKGYWEFATQNRPQRMEYLADLRDIPRRAGACFGETNHAQILTPTRVRRHPSSL
jgi:hypothetical protein